MNIGALIAPNLVLAKQHVSTREEALSKLARLLFENEYIASVDEFLADVYKREEHSETGMENGLAIPHGKSKAVNKAGFAVMTLDEPMKKGAWPSLNPENKVDVIFLLAIPESEAGTTHLKLLAELSSRLVDENYLNAIKTANSSEEIVALLSEEKEEKTSEKVNSDKFLLAITSCATGIAHTYMAAETLEKKATEMGIKIHVEKQGANGLEDKITPEMVKKASGIIFAVDTKVKERERFAGLPYVQVKVAEPLKRSEEIINQALNSPQGIVEGTVEEIATNSGTEKKGIKNEIITAVMTGISYMIPLLVAAGLMLGIAKLVWSLALGMDPAVIGEAAYRDTGGLVTFLHYLDAFGNLLFKFIYPVFAMFAAYSIADRLGLVAGFAGGLFAGGLHYTFWGIDGGIPSGFLGALVLGIAAGYFSRFLNNKIKLSKNLSAMKPMFLVPGLSVLFIFVLNMYFVDPVFGALNKWIADVITNMSGAGEIGLSAVIAAATAFDLGGPVNKAAGAIAIGLAADGIFPLTARVLAIVIPPLGLGLSTMIDRFVVGRRVYSQELRVVGGTSFLLGFLAISEGAIPFMLRNPLITIPINVIGAIVGSCTAVALGAVQWLPLPAVWGWPLVEHLPAYLIGLLAGVLVIAFGNIFVRYAIIKRKEAKGKKVDM
ncbi:fructose-specific PTS transporter subunit EIIC [Listeria goaensis]|uniref:fructose-specific PTS transporter subunit EIIC n=1 Tax=Listeria goaensis TaxID=1649188 RepID=UPI000B59244B|nr:fructose-specific PTS transporter subunit EIIC [Listeria goaensis]